MEADSRLEDLKIDFPPGWINISNENPEGPPTFLKSDLEEPGVLQISNANYLSGEHPIPSVEDLLGLSESAGLKSQFGKIVGKESGVCKFGIFGTVLFYRNDFPYISLTHITNGKDFVFATFICSKLPGYTQMAEVRLILQSIRKK